MFDKQPFGSPNSLVLPPVDLATNPSTDWCRLADVNKWLVFEVYSAAGAVGADPVFSMSQAKDNAGTDLIPLALEKVFWKKGTGVGGAFTRMDDRWTEETSPSHESPSSTYNSTGHTPGASESVHLILVRPIDLNEGYTHARLNITCPGSKVGCVVASPIGYAYTGRENFGVIDPA